MVRLGGGYEIGPKRHKARRLGHYYCFFFFFFFHFIFYWANLLFLGAI